MRARRAFVRAFSRYQLKGVMQHARLLTPRGVFSRNDCKMKLCLTSADKHEHGKYAPGRIFEKAFNNTPPRGVLLGGGRIYEKLRYLFYTQARSQKPKGRAPDLSTKIFL